RRAQRIDHLLPVQHLLDRLVGHEHRIAAGHGGTPQGETIFSTARPIARIFLSAMRSPIRVSPTGAAPFSWHGTLSAQRSSRFAIEALRMTMTKKSWRPSSVSVNRAISGAVTAMVGNASAS